MGVDFYLKLDQASETVVCQFLSELTGADVAPIHLAVYRAMYKARPSYVDDQVFWETHPECQDQTQEPSYRFFELVQATPAIAVLDYYCLGGSVSYLYLGRARNFGIRDSDGEMVDMASITRALAIGGVSDKAAVTILPYVELAYWG